MKCHRFTTSILLTLVPMSPAAAGGREATEAPTTEAIERVCDDGFRLFAHVEGETCIPENPRHIVAPMDDETATPLLDLGASVAASGFRRIEGREPFIRGVAVIFGPNAAETEGIVDVGDPNLRVAQRKP